MPRCSAITGELKRKRFGGFSSHTDLLKVRDYVLGLSATVIYEKRNDVPRRQRRCDLDRRKQQLQSGECIPPSNRPLHRQAPERSAGEHDKRHICLLSASRITPTNHREGLESRYPSVMGMCVIVVAEFHVQRARRSPNAPDH
jgi:hypothetical protein